MPAWKQWVSDSNEFLRLSQEHDRHLEELSGKGFAVAGRYLTTIQEAHATVRKPKSR